MPTVENERINARSDGGTTHIVIETQNIIETRMLDGSVSRTKGLKSLRLQNGAAVNHIDDDTFKIVQTDEIIRRVK
ncbi:hypothetical protein [Mesorhizobium sp.]|uniref:hypothetical protein n=1 Tax=Mesorhizobium sp. TaxID=1871066 RepID=UPI000FE7C677|nr:hypothetical protein [Mesorhizobium sp.]RWC61071.1 MAG: hypothetical protein EOS29_18970 [Mesorhizobium sp.]